MSRTKRLWEALENEERMPACESVVPTFPAKFLVALRSALEAGMSCEQIECILVLAGGVCECGSAFERGELMRRCSHLLEVMNTDRRLER